MEDQLKKASWFPFSDEPVLVGPWYLCRLSNPAFLFPEDSPDGKWHLFAGSWLGIHHYVSDSGIHWEPLALVQVRGAMPSLFQEKGLYYLVYERHGRLVPLLERLSQKSRQAHLASSHIEMRSSTDLLIWSEPRILLDGRGIKAACDYLDKPQLSHPQIVAVDGGYRLYFGASLVAAPGTRWKAARYIYSAFSPSLDGTYEPLPMTFEPIPNDPWRNMASGQLRVIKRKEGYTAFQTALYWDPHRTRMASSIVLLDSKDGHSWEAVCEKPILVSTEYGWASRYLCSCDVRYKGDEDCWYCYFSAMGEKRFGLERESIGLLIGKAPALRKAAPDANTLFLPR